MKEVILLLTVLVMFIVCFFVMGKIGYFINENYKAFIIEERENTQSCKIISLDKISDEELLIICWICFKRLFEKKQYFMIFKVSN